MSDRFGERRDLPIEEIEIPPEVEAAGLSILDWFETEAFDRYFDTVAPALTKNQVLVRAMWSAMLAAHRKIEPDESY